MKPPLRSVIRFSPVAWLAIVILLPQAVAQTLPKIDIQTYAGLTITGEAGKVYSVEYVTDLCQTNDAGAWRCLVVYPGTIDGTFGADDLGDAISILFHR